MTARFSRLLLAAGTLLAVQGLSPASAEACTPPEPGIFSRDVFPDPGATAVPTNARVVVSYLTGRNYGFPADAGDPGIGTDLELRRKGGAGVAVNRVSADSYLNGRHVQVSVVLTPAQPLAPAVEYEVLDRRPNIPCGPSRPATCALGATTVVGTFTTGPGPNAASPPAPAGAMLSAGAFDRCESLGSCCGAWAVRFHHVRWSDPVGGAFLYNFYDSTGALVRFMRGNQLQLALGCSGSGDPGALWVMPGALRVSAVDWAGHEGPALELGTIPASACVNAALPDAGPDLNAADVGVDAPIDTVVAPDLAPPDVGPDAGVDAAAPVPVARDAAPLDTRAPDATPSPELSSGCDCQLGGAPAPTGPVLLGLLLAAVALVRRRR